MLVGQETREAGHRCRRAQARLPGGRRCGQGRPDSDEAKSVRQRLAELKSAAP